MTREQRTCEASADEAGELSRERLLEEAEIEQSQARIGRLTGICPKCGDSGWWIDDGPVIYCDCPAGIVARKAARYDHKAALAQHEAGMLDGTIYALPEVLPQMFGGQRNFGATGPDSEGNTIPSVGVETSDGWLYQFQSEELAQGFIAAHPKGGTNGI